MGIPWGYLGRIYDLGESKNGEFTPTWQKWSCKIRKMMRRQFYSMSGVALSSDKCHLAFLTKTFTLFHHFRPDMTRCVVPLRNGEMMGKMDMVYYGFLPHLGMAQTYTQTYPLVNKHSY